MAQVLTRRSRRMKRNRSLLTADIMQVRLDAEIKVAERVTEARRRDGKAAL